MKKVYLVIFMAVVTFVAYSCTQDDVQKSVPQVDPTIQTAFDDLNDELSIIDMQFPDAPMTRRGGRFWRIFGADFFGGLLGWFLHPVVGVISGVSASCAAAHDFNRYNQTVAYVPNERYVYELQMEQQSITLNGIDSIGIMHNKIICELYDEQGDAFFLLDKEQMDKLILQKVEKYYGKVSDVKLQQLPELEKKVNQTVELMDAESMDASFNKAVELLPEYKNEILVTKTYCKKMNSLPTEESRLEYDKQFKKVLTDSKIPSESKDVILSSTRIASNSNVMWHEKSLK